MSGLPPKPPHRPWAPGLQPTSDDTGADPLAALDALVVSGAIDLLQALQVTGGDCDRYLRLLRQFVTLHARDMAGLASAADPDAKALVHTLRGVARTLGLQALDEAATELHALLRSPSPLAEADRALRAALVAEVVQAHARLATGLAIAAPSPGSPGGVA